MSNQTVIKDNINIIDTDNAKTTLVLKNKSQDAYLTAIYNPNSRGDDNVFIYTLKGYNATEWKLTYEEVAIVYARKEVSVTPESKFENDGLFTIGNHKDWLYSHQLFSLPDELEKEIYLLLKYSLTGR